jgi:hypothetical protein
MKALSLLLWLTTITILSALPSNADTVPTCPSVSNLYQAHVFCHFSGQQLQLLLATHEPGISYAVEPMCVETQDEEQSCINQERCEAPPDTFKFMVFRSSPGSPNVPWGTVCLDTDAVTELDVITPGRVLAEMKKLEWPEAELTIQPPDGRTLVNFKTNFLTTTTEPATQTVTLLGQQVQIEATPVDYTWHFGDGETQSGPDPGAAYPDLRITHVYVEADVTVTPSVDVTYRGSYRIDGGSWQDIPETLTVEGTPVDLQVLSATPHLVG